MSVLAAPAANFLLVLQQAERQQIPEDKSEVFLYFLRPLDRLPCRAPRQISQDNSFPRLHRLLTGAVTFAFEGMTRGSSRALPEEDVRMFPAQPALSQLTSKI
jgi:hypothetical protein